MSTAQTIAKRFLEYLREEGMQDELGVIAAELTREAERRQVITVMSAEPLTEKDRAKLTTALVKKWGEHEVEFTVDASLLSGLLIAFKDQVIDMSGRNALTDLKEQLS